MLKVDFFTFPRFFIILAKHLKEKIIKGAFSIDRPNK